MRSRVVFIHVNPFITVMRKGRAKEGKGKKVSREGRRNVNVWIDEKVRDRADAFLESQRMKTSITVLVELSLREFLDREEKKAATS
jgi:hypothetical protein